jgi:hypothetical protein
MRSRAKRAVPWLASLCVCAALAACGDEDEPSPPEPPRETVDHLPKLPDDWKPYVDRRIGVAIGRAPGWRARSRGGTVLLRSPDHLVALSISVDRTLEATGFALDDYVVQAAEALPGYRKLRVGRPRPFAAKYRARAVGAKGIENGVRQRMLFIALRRDAVATYPALVARNAEKDSGYYNDEAMRMVRTLRGRPPGGGG